MNKILLVTVFSQVNHCCQASAEHLCHKINAHRLEMHIGADALTRTLTLMAVVTIRRHACHIMFVFLCACLLLTC